jgi:hypothetical protein
VSLPAVLVLRQISICQIVNLKLKLFSYVEQDQ